jgi:hypothetical protein
LAVAASTKGSDPPLEVLQGVQPCIVGEVLPSRRWCDGGDDSSVDEGESCDKLLVGRDAGGVLVLGPLWLLVRRAGCAQTLPIVLGVAGAGASAGW